MTGTSDDADLTGRQLGDFKVLRRLGRGAMAEVYLAEQGSLARRVAIKVLKRHLAEDEVYVRRFHNEAKAAASLVHANIVQIYDVGLTDGVHYIAQEYVQGQNLQELLTRRGTPDLKLTLAILRQVAAALNKASAAGIVHRDIKPENIMLARGGEVKVADFGLARTGQGDGVGLTQVGQTMGTPLYMSPEQVQGRPLDPRSDIYSFGVTCFHMLTGRPPFTGDTPLGVALLHLNAQPERLEELRPDLPVTLCRIVHKMLAKDPDQRYSTASELLRELRSVRVPGDDGGWSDELDEVDGTLSDVVSQTQAATQRLEVLMRTSNVQARRRKRAWLAVTMVVLLSFLAGGAFGWTRRPEFLLADASPARVPRQETAHDQLIMAKYSGSEDWLKSVEQYFPDDEFYVGESKRDLARMYLNADRYEDALALFNELAKYDESLRAFGLAGRSIVLTWQKQYDEATQSLAELWPIRINLDQRMRQLVRTMLEKHKDALEERTSRQDADLIQRWQSADFGPDEGPEAKPDAVDSQPGLR